MPMQEKKTIHNEQFFSLASTPIAPEEMISSLT
jgi:hypothetical protein